MNKEVKALWLDALRSGEYKQGKVYLRQYNEVAGEFLHCCLGVLCELYATENSEGEQLWFKSPSGVHYFNPAATGIYGDQAEAGILPTDVAVWAGLTPSGYPADGEMGTDTPHLPTLNDDDGWTFEEIADVIEQKL